MRYILISLVGFALLIWVSQAETKSVSVIALFDGRAMIVVDDSKAKIVRAGSSHRGVKLISSNTDEAIVEVDGLRQSLTLDGTAVLSQPLGDKPASSYASSVTIFENAQGFFEHPGQVNGKGLKFLIDTGANLVVLSSNQADRAGIEYRDGDKLFASTASGTAPMFMITLDEVSLGGIVLKNIETGVIIGDFPQKPLLGMTFLSKVDMTRVGNKMVLKRR